MSLYFNRRVLDRKSIEKYRWLRLNGEEELEPENVISDIISDMPVLEKSPKEKVVNGNFSGISTGYRFTTYKIESAGAQRELRSEFKSFSEIASDDLVLPDMAGTAILLQLWYSMPNTHQSNNELVIWSGANRYHTYYKKTHRRPLDSDCCTGTSIGLKQQIMEAGRLAKVCETPHKSTTGISKHFVLYGISAVPVQYGTHALQRIH
ncbi:hypothetical protein HOY80DRAFT_1000520 [Tuber brumale]|nr:hypothetical protein HOY80DRAFT_1000520 [Tuber brumale]